MMDLFLSMIVEEQLFFFCEKAADLRVFHFQCQVLDVKEGVGLGAWLPFLLLLTLCCFFFNLYLILI